MSNLANLINDIKDEELKRSKEKLKQRATEIVRDSERMQESINRNTALLEKIAHIIYNGTMADVDSYYANREKGEY